MNLRLMTNLGRLANVFVLDAARWQAAVGPAAVNPRAWYVGQRSATRPLVVEAARDLRAALASLLGRRRQLLVLEPQVARWEGESGGLPASQRQAFADFQQLLRILERKGITVAVAEPLQGAEALTALVRRLGLELDAAVYISASEVLRARVRSALPAVYVPDWPKDVLLYPSALQSLRCFDR